MKTRFMGAVLALWASTVCATPSPCQPPPASATAMWFGSGFGSSERFDREPETKVSIQRRQFGYRADRPTDRVGFSYQHEYSIVDIDALPRAVAPPAGATDVDPSSNGHLHTLAASLDLSYLLGPDWQVGLQPALSISSNLLKDPTEMDSDAWQLAFALFRRYAVTPSNQWQVGLCGDHRFGNYRVYPSIRWLWQNPKWHLQLGYPDTDLRARLRPTWHTGLRLLPAGNRWRVHDADAGDTFFTHRAWQAEWYLGWQITRAWQADISLGQLMNSHYRFTLETGERFRSDTDSPTQLRLTLLWRGQ